MVTFEPETTRLSMSTGSFGISIRNGLKIDTPTIAAIARSPPPALPPAGPHEPAVARGRGKARLKSCVIGGVLAETHRRLRDGALQDRAAQRILARKVWPRPASILARIGEQCFRCPAAHSRCAEWGRSFDHCDRNRADFPDLLSRMGENVLGLQPPRSSFARLGRKSKQAFASSVRPSRASIASSRRGAHADAVRRRPRRRVAPR